MKKTSILALSALLLAPALGWATTPNAYIAAASPSQESHAPTVGSPIPSCIASFRKFSVDKITYQIRCINITDITAAHIHNADADSNGGVLVTLYNNPGGSGTVVGFLTKGSFQRSDFGTSAEYDAIITAMETDQAYFNAHTPTNPGGEVRGQIVPIRLPVAPKLPF